MFHLRIIACVFLLMTFACSDVARAKEPKLPEGVIDCGKDNVVLFEITKSPDGRFAIGWTIRAKDPKTPPVDWSQWDENNFLDFLNRYSDWGERKSDSKYELINCIVDLKKREALELPSDWPNYPHKNRGYLVAVWSPARKSVRYTIVQNDSRFYTHNLWLVTIDEHGMREDDIVGRLCKEVGKVLRDKRPLSFEDFGIYFPIVTKDDAAVQKASFSGDSANIPFLADIPKSLDDKSSVEGTITISLPEGKVIRVSSSTPRDDPFESDKKLAKADKALNQTYAELRKKFNPEAQEALKKEQIEWIKQRNSQAREKAQDVSINGETLFAEIRNKTLLEETEKRTAELKQRLNPSARGESSN